MSCIQVTDDAVTVGMSPFVKHDGYLHRIPTLYRALHHHRQEIQDRKLVFHLPDAEPISFSGLDKVLEHICHRYDLPSDRVLVKMMHATPAFRTNWATVETFAAPDWQRCQRLIQRDLCHPTPGAKLFGAAFGRYTPARLTMACWLETNWPQDSFVIFQPAKDVVEFELEPSREVFAAELKWLEHRTDNADLQPNDPAGGVSLHACLPVYHEIFSRYSSNVETPASPGIGNFGI
jgi:hypothetical protein